MLLRNEGPEEGKGMKRVLVISYYFPPSGGPGVQRVLKFVKYLPAFGWLPTVLTVDPKHASYPDLDPTLAEEIPEEVSVIRTRSWDPYALYARTQGKAKDQTVGVGFSKDEDINHWKQRMARWIRANVFIPDARRGWIRYAKKAAYQLIKENDFDLVFTSGPPHSTYLIGRWIKKKFGLPWVADFRDPWTDISYYVDLPRTFLTKALEAHMEKSVLDTVDAAISVSDGVGRLLKAKVDNLAYETIPNGYDLSDIAGAEKERHRPSIEFLIGHVGTLSVQQSMPGLAAALAERYAHHADWQDRLKVRFVGHVDASIVDAFSDAGLSEAIEVVSYVPHAEAIDHMRQASVLLVSVQQVERTEGVTPAKMFEYLSLGIPVLGFGSPTGDMAAIIQETRGGAVFEHDAKDGIGAFLDIHFDRVLRGIAPEAPDRAALQNYDRRVHTQKLVQLFNALIS